MVLEHPDVQAFDATLTSIAALGTAADKLAYTTGLDTWAEATITPKEDGTVDPVTLSLKADACPAAAPAAE